MICRTFGLQNLRQFAALFSGLSNSTLRGFLCRYPNPAGRSFHSSISNQETGVQLLEAILNNPGADLMLEYELFFKYSMDMYVIAGADGYFKRANPAFCNILGRSEVELLSRPFIELIHPDDVAKVQGALKNLGSGHPAFLVEVRLLAADGTYRDLRWTAYPDPKSGMLFAIARDYTVPYFDAQRVKLLMDSSPTAVFLVEQTGTIT